jgi:acetolactate synthase I/II/III large subunit
MNAAQLLVRCLENEGVRYVFGVPGEETLHILDALSESDIAFIATRHEQGAAFMADVYGRLSTYPGVCLATLGPGASNLLTGVADAHLDRSPVVAITGQAGLERMHKESHQYVDVVGMFQPITKFTTRVQTPDTIPEIVRKAFRLARLEKPGATHLELPEDVAELEVDAQPIPVRRTRYPQAAREVVEEAAELIAKAERPIILAGNGVIRRQATGHGAADALRTFAERFGIPVTHTFMGKGALSADHPLSLPAVGLQRSDAELAGIDQADVVVAVGYDLVEWSPVYWNPARDKTIIHVDSTAAEIDGHYLPALEVVGEIGESLETLAEACHREARDWLQPSPRDLVRQELARHAADPSIPMKPQRIVAELRQALGDDDILISDVGAHKLWISRFYPTTRPNTVVIANGYASMGISLPGAIAAKLVHPERKVISVKGDGGFLMNVQELETARRLRTAFVAVVLVDQRFGVIELNQQRKFGRTFGVEFTNPDFVQLARAFDLPGYLISDPADFLPTLRRAQDLDTASIIAVPFDSTQNRRLAERLEVRE